MLGLRERMEENGSAPGTGEAKRSAAAPADPEVVDRPLRRRFSPRHLRHRYLRVGVRGSAPCSGPTPKPRGMSSPSKAFFQSSSRSMMSSHVYIRPPTPWYYGSSFIFALPSEPRRRDFPWPCPTLVGVGGKWDARGALNPRSTEPRHHGRLAHPVRRERASERTPIGQRPVRRLHSRRQLPSHAPCLPGRSDH